MFKAKFEQGADISDKQAVLNISKQFNLETQVSEAINNPDSKAFKKFREYNNIKKQKQIYATPTLIINNNLIILPKHTANNANLMVENLIEILQDLQCRQYALCNKQ